MIGALRMTFSLITPEVRFRGMAAGDLLRTPALYLKKNADVRICHNFYSLFEFYNCYR